MLNNFIQNILDKIQGNSWGEGYVVYSKDIYERPIPFSKTIRRNNMKKAILVNDYASVGALNKLFEQGYTVESLDDRGVYILKRDESKKYANDLHETPDKHLNVFDRKDKEGAFTFQPEQFYYERLVQLEAKLSTAITEIDKLKATIKIERALTDQMITDAVIKAKITNGK